VSPQKTKVIVKVGNALATQSQFASEVGRITGLIDAQNFCKLMNVLSVDSNPRKPKESSVTKEIIETLETKPERMHLMSKGLLLSARRCNARDRDRYEIDFQSNRFATPGILDGGHNTFAIAKHLLNVFVDSASLKSVRDWEQILSVWHKNSEEIEELIKATFSSTNPSREHKFQVPIEIIYPLNPDDPESLEVWGECHRDITHARNNNVQLTDATKDNHQGLYNYLKDKLPDYIKREVEWKTNDGGTIKSADVIALALVPLSVLSKAEIGAEIALPKLYNSKQYCVETFRNTVTYKSNSVFCGQEVTIKSPLIMAALDLTPKMLEIYDHVYEKFPDCYNEAGGKFGRIEGVRIFSQDPKHLKDPKYSKKRFTTKFLQRDCEYQYAEGFIIPLVVAVRELLKVDYESKSITWETDPIDFLTKKMSMAVSMYSTFIKNAGYDPRLIGKDKGTYQVASLAYKAALRGIS
jgi:AIPR protein